jgi:hypothetical protein
MGRGKQVKRVEFSMWGLRFEDGEIITRVNPLLADFVMELYTSKERAEKFADFFVVNEKPHPVHVTVIVEEEGE